MTKDTEASSKEQNNDLLETIRLPKNLSKLNNYLPK